MDKYICTVCDYVYDPELGDPEMALEREHRLKIFLKIGFARYAELEKKNLSVLGRCFFFTSLLASTTFTT